MKRIARVLCAVAALACSAVPAGAGPITVGAGWEYFGWQNGPGVWNDEGAFTFDVPFSTDLKVTDLFVDGDQFEVYDGGSLIGTTSLPADDGAWIGDPDAAFADARWSSGEYLLGPGAHSLTFKTIRVPTGAPSGDAGFRVDAVVPAPAAVVLGILGVSLVGTLRRRRML